MNPPRALGWVGGKSFYGPHGTGRWIAGLLPPPEATYTYVEPYAGMLGVLLQRRPAQREVVSDLDSDLVNWWRVVRDYPLELTELIEWTPAWSVDLFVEAAENLDHPDAVRRAYYFTLAVSWVRQGIVARVRNADRPEEMILRTKQARHWFGDKTSWGQLAGRPADIGFEDIGLPRHPRIVELSTRIRRLQLETKSAEWMTEYYGSNPNLTLYLDPPYPSVSGQRLYSFEPPHVEEWSPRLLEAKARTAISGYGDEWAVLEEAGWLRHEHTTRSSAAATEEKGMPKRVEVLWTNYDPKDYEAEPELFGGKEDR